MTKTHVIIVAAGRGSRFGGDMPKQFRMLGDRPVLMETIIGIGRALPRAEITIVLSAEFVAFWERCCESAGFVSPRVVTGGDTRWESVKNAIEAIAPSDDSYVLIHDGARPVVKADMIKRIMSALDAGATAVVPAVPVTDSLREISDTGGDSHAFDRSRVVAVQTPQAFRGDVIRKSYTLPYDSAFTDDATVCEAAGFGSPVIVEGSPVNLKITRPRDLEIAALFLR